MAHYKIIDTVLEKHEKENYKPSKYETFKEAKKALKEIIDEVNFKGGILCIPVSEVCYSIEGLYVGYSKRLGSIYIKKFED